MFASANIFLGFLGLGGSELIILLVVLIGIILLVGRMRRKKPNNPPPSNVSNVYINNQSHASVQPNAHSSASERLAQLKKLKDEGIISDEDYLKKKDEIMRSF